MTIFLIILAIGAVLTSANVSYHIGYSRGFKAGGRYTIKRMKESFGVEYNPPSE